MAMGRRGAGGTLTVGLGMLAVPLLAGCGLFGGDEVEPLNESPLGITIEIPEDLTLDDAKAAAREHCRRYAARPVLGYTAFEGDDRQVAFFECR